MTNADEDTYTVDDTVPFWSAMEAGGGVTTGGEAEKSESRADEVLVLLALLDPRPWKAAPLAELVERSC